MIWPKIQRDETNTIITNKNEIIEFINNCYHLLLLENYLSQLKTQTKVSISEVEPIILATESRIEVINSFLKEYEENKNDTNTLAIFYENNINFIKGIIKLYNSQTEKNEINKNTMKILIDFLMFAVSREKNNEINLRETQMAFEDFYNTKKSIVDIEYGDLLKNIYDAHKVILNKVDETAMQYKEKDYKKLTLTNTETNGYNLTEEEDITNLNTKAFITTAIVLQATLVLTLILSLLAIVK